jgi:DNA helicase-2/ATP-dependent DNA helicase PcrA
MEKIYLTSTSKRRFFGTEQRSIPSRFILEIPRKLLHWESYQMRQAEESYDSYRALASTKAGLSLNLDGNGNGVHNNGYRIGEKVIHPLFGQGIVKKIEGIGNDTKVVISFSDHGSKKILASFLGLRKA